MPNPAGRCSPEAKAKVEEIAKKLGTSFPNCSKLGLLEDGGIIASAIGPVETTVFVKEITGTGDIYFTKCTKADLAGYFHVLDSFEDGSTEIYAVDVSGTIYDWTINDKFEVLKQSVYRDPDFFKAAPNQCAPTCSINRVKQTGSISPAKLKAAKDLLLNKSE